MNLLSKKRTLAFGAFGALSALALTVSAQTFDTPPSDFALEPAPFNTSFIGFPPLPTTLNAGDFDGSVVSAVTGASLNDVAVGGIPSFLDNEGGGSLTNRVWTIVHDDPNNPRSLVQSVPSDVVSTDEFEDTYYFQPSSLQITDLNQDGQNDIALIDSGVPEAEIVVEPANTIKLGKVGFGNPANVIGIPGQASAPFFGTSNNFLGGQDGDANIPAAFFTELSQNAMTLGDFDGDGVSDLAFYDFSFTGAAQGILGNDIAAVLKNDGTFNILPRTDTDLLVPSDVGEQNAGFNVVSGDFNDDGLQDIAFTFDTEEDADRLLAFLGNGDGTFNPEPVVNVQLPDNGDLHGFVVGDFDGNSFLDFAVTSQPQDTEAAFSQLVVVTCSAGTPANCTADIIDLDNTLGINLAAGDFNSDGLDDLALSRLQCSGDTCNLSEIAGNVGVFLNQGGSFAATADQSLLLGAIEARQFILQVVSKDIDGCGGPDLAYTGFQFPESSPMVTPAMKLATLGNGLKAGILPDGTSDYASVAFNANEAPTADAGEGTVTPGGVLVGGEPTCSDPTDDTQAILWEVVSGTATISDPTAANPLVTDASDGAVLRVTCTDACGLSASDTVTITGSALIEGSGCSLSMLPTAGSSAAWLLGLAGFLPALALRGRRK